MNIIICYKYIPYATALYFEKALKTLGHNVFSVNSIHRKIKGFQENVDVSFISKEIGFVPDLVLLIDPDGDFFPCGWEKMKCPTAVYLVDVHLSFNLREIIAPFFDYLFVAQLDYVDKFRDLGFLKVDWLPLACDPDIHRKRTLDVAWDIGFVGRLNSEVRANRLKLLSDRYSLNDYKLFYPKEKIAEIYSKSRIVFNSSINGDLNMRVFEGLASGSLVVTDKIANGQSELFKNGIHFVEYANDQELIDILDYYLEHADERERIAQAGHDLAISEHTYVNRCQAILETIFSNDPPILGSKIRNLDQASVRSAYARVYTNYALLNSLLDELNIAWKSKQGYLRLIGYVIITFCRVLFRIFRHNYYNTYLKE